MVRVLKTRGFARFMRKEGLTNDALHDAVARAERGLIDADLGGGVIKQRVARPGQGRSGGFRTLIAFRAAERSVFLFGFAKSDRDNIDAAELKVLRKAAAEMLSWNEKQVAVMLAHGAWTEVNNEREEIREQDCGGGA
jgi:hypothetical protein